MSRKPDKDIDMQKVYDLRMSGHTGLEVATIFECNESTLASRLARWCDRNGIPRPPRIPKKKWSETISVEVPIEMLDRGMVGALYRAGWLIEEIAGECGTSAEIIEKVIEEDGLDRRRK